MLIAQSLSEDMPLMTGGPSVQQYGSDIIW
jgi:hypothetical protein